MDFDIIYDEKTISFLSSLIPFGRVLDLGSGTGFIQSKIYRKWFGIERDQEAVNFAKKHFVSLICDDIRNPFPFSNNSFDAVSMINILHHVPDDLTKVLKECKRVLKPKGSVLIVEPNADNIPLRLQSSGKLSTAPDLNERCLKTSEVFKAMRSANIICDNEIGSVTIKPLYQGCKREIKYRRLKLALVNILRPLSFGKKTHMIITGVKPWN